MKKLSVLIALALLVVAGTGFAVTCTNDNVPAATLLVPYFRVSGNGTTGGDLASSGTDTLCAVTNVSATGLIAHVTVWNKYSYPVLDFNVPMTGYDVIFFSMRDILNGKLNVNPTFQKYTVSGGISYDPCGQVFAPGQPTTYAPVIGFAAKRYIRFSAIDTTDALGAVSVYSTPAFTGTFRWRVWGSLDESGDISDWYGTTSTNIIDDSNFACGDPDPAVTPAFKGDFSGYLTIDVVNYCTIRFPDQILFYTNDIIATVGWGGSPGPNVLFGDIFYLDGTLNTGNISGDPMVAIEFDSRLNWLLDNTFFGRYVGTVDNARADQAAPYTFGGDGREPLGGYNARYGFRYVQDNLGTGGSTSLRSWALIWRGDVYFDYTTANAASTDFNSVNLCAWWAYVTGRGGVDYGFTDGLHLPTITVFDNDENTITQGGGPSGGPGQGNPVIELETQRMVITPSNIVPTNFYGGWIGLTLPGTYAHNGAWVGVQHTGYGLAVSVGHAATLLNNDFVCNSSGVFGTFAVGPFGHGRPNLGRANQTN